MRPSPLTSPAWTEITRGSGRGRPARTGSPSGTTSKEGSGYNNPKHPTGDLCQGPPVVTLSLNGSSTQLVLDDKTKKWVPAGDDGSRVELLKGVANGDNEKKYWRVTNEEGVQYYFGMDRLPGWASGKPETNSAWSVPVYGNHPNEPCHKAAYGKKRNHYGSNVTREGKSTNRGYDRGG